MRRRLRGCALAPGVALSSAGGFFAAFCALAPSAAFGARVGPPPPPPSDVESLMMLVPFVVVVGCVYMLSRERNSNVQNAASSAPPSALSFASVSRCCRLFLRVVSIRADSVAPGGAVAAVRPKFLAGLCYVSYVCLILLPPIILRQQLQPEAICLPANLLFSGAFSKQLILRILAHSFYLSKFSTIFWLIGAPFLLHSLAALLERQHVDSLWCFLSLHLLTILLVPGIDLRLAESFGVHLPDGDKDLCLIGLDSTLYALAAVIFLLNPRVPGDMYGDPSVRLPFEVELRHPAMFLVFGLFLFSSPSHDPLVGGKLLGSILAAVLFMLATDPKQLQEFAVKALSLPRLVVLALLTYVVLLLPLSWKRYPFAPMLAGDFTAPWELAQGSLYEGAIAPSRTSRRRAACPFPQGCVAWPSFKRALFNDWCSDGSGHAAPRGNS
eukprot:GHVT01100497.1.p2 GENE.GHVT01100497.1~~GHVT01100497.1.p2  ORF type:complete len:440 (-),score=95.79 GHVT01100497.1:1629-2948(-)